MRAHVNRVRKVNARPNLILACDALAFYNRRECEYEADGSAETCRVIVVISLFRGFMRTARVTREEVLRKLSRDHDVRIINEQPMSIRIKMAPRGFAFGGAFESASGIVNSCSVTETSSNKERGRKRRGKITRSEVFIG